MSDDDRMDDLIRAAAAGYNPPPAVPRDEMWAVIEAAQTNRAAAAPSAAPKLYVVPASAGSAADQSAPHGVRSEARTTPRLAWWNMAAAAALLIATGVGIGRWTTTERRDAENQRAAAPPSIVLESPAVVTASGPVAQDITGSPLAVATGATDPTGGTSATQSDGMPSTGPIVRTLARQSRAPRRSESRARIPPGSQSVIPYQIATIRHLTDAEALLTSFTLESRDQRTDSQLAGWAKGLLSNTRLLLDSPAGDDPRRAKLLEDLELVLAQIVQLSPGAAAQERDLINGSIRNGAVMTRLRTAIPAGQTKGF